jgi:hypothetical protein
MVLYNMTGNGNVITVSCVWGSTAIFGYLESGVCGAHVKVFSFVKLKQFFKHDNHPNITRSTFGFCMPFALSNDTL